MSNNRLNKAFLDDSSKVSAEAYRTPMQIKKVMIIKEGRQNLGYYMCPRCNVSMEREFTSFCDRCGQALNWNEYKKAERVYSFMKLRT